MAGVPPGDSPDHVTQGWRPSWDSLAGMWAGALWTESSWGSGLGSYMAQGAGRPAASRPGQTVGRRATPLNLPETPPGLCDLGPRHSRGVGHPAGSVRLSLEACPAPSASGRPHAQPLAPREVWATRPTHLGLSLPLQRMGSKTTVACLSPGPAHCPGRPFFGALGRGGVGGCQGRSAGVTVTPPGTQPSSTSVCPEAGHSASEVGMRSLFGRAGVDRLTPRVEGSYPAQPPASPR